MSEHRYRHVPSSPRLRKIADETDELLAAAVMKWLGNINHPAEQYYDDAWDEFMDRAHDQFDAYWNLEARDD